MKKKEKTHQWQRNNMNNLVMDYHVYEMSGQEKLTTFFVALIVGGLAGLIFYGGLFKKDGAPTQLTYIADIVIFLVTGTIAGLLLIPARQKQLLEKRQKSLRSQFRDMLESVTTSLAAGDTVVQAFDNAYKDMCEEFGQAAYISREVEQFVDARKNNVSLEIVVDDFAKRSACEDVESFASVFKASYGPGGRMSDVMRNTHDIITEKMEVEDEVASKLSSNKLELNLISAMPVIIVGLLRLTNPTFAENFATIQGIMVNTVAIVIFIAAFAMGQNIIRIKT